ncbi:hypothetical protein BC829DRAFT_385153 [Chytridium lagenaria]|nr:hypothetical protein BC829DRAFT_385153 [Chytridium lagenaria]
MQNLSSPAQPQPQQPTPQQPTRSPSPPKAFNPVLAAVAASDGIQSLMRIIHPYNPTLADELQLVVGADIIVLRSFDDGWGLGMNPITGAQGAFPLVCVANDNRSSMAPSEVPASVVPDRFSKRVSSAIFTADQMNALKTVGKEEYLRTHGYDPALDEGLPSAPPTAASYGYPSFTGSVMIDPATGMPMGVTFSEGGNSMHVYPVRDSMTSSVVTPRV